MSMIDIVENNTQLEEENSSLRRKNRLLRKELMKKQQVFKATITTLVCFIGILFVVVMLERAAIKEAQLQVEHTFLYYQVEDGEGLYSVASKFPTDKDVRNTMNWLKAHNKLRFYRGEPVLDKGQVLIVKTTYEQAKELVASGKATYVPTEVQVEKELH